MYTYMYAYTYISWKDRSETKWTGAKYPFYKQICAVSYTSLRQIKTDRRSDGWLAAVDCGSPFPTTFLFSPYSNAISINFRQIIVFLFVRLVSTRRLAHSWRTAVTLSLTILIQSLIMIWLLAQKKIETKWCIIKYCNNATQPLINR